MDSMSFNNPIYAPAQGFSVPVEVGHYETSVDGGFDHQVGLSNPMYEASGFAVPMTGQHAPAAYGTVSIFPGAEAAYGYAPTGTQDALYYKGSGMEMYGSHEQMLSGKDGYDFASSSDYDLTGVDGETYAVPIAADHRAENPYHGARSAQAFGVPTDDGGYLAISDANAGFRDSTTEAQYLEFREHPYALATASSSDFIMPADDGSYLALSGAYSQAPFASRAAYPRVGHDTYLRVGHASAYASPSSTGSLRRDGPTTSTGKIAATISVVTASEGEMPATTDEAETQHYAIPREEAGGYMEIFPAPKYAELKKDEGSREYIRNTPSTVAYHRLQAFDIPMENTPEAARRTDLGENEYLPE